MRSGHAAHPVSEGRGNHGQVKKMRPAVVDGGSTSGGQAEAPLRVRWLVSDNRTTYLIKGHVAADAMLAAVRAHGEESPEKYTGPTQGWWRCYPKRDDTGDLVTWYAPAEPHARGAFKCTVMSKDW